MHPNTEFVRNWLRIHIDFLDLSNIYLGSYETNKKTNGDENTKVTFSVYGYKLFGGQKIYFDIPKCIDLKYFYAALYSLHSSTINTNVTEEKIAEILGTKSTFAKLQELT